MKKSGEQICHIAQICSPVFVMGYAFNLLHICHTGTKIKINQTSDVTYRIWR